MAIAKEFEGELLRFDYQGGWPKKRNWALESYDWSSDWILLLDADELLSEAVKLEIEDAISHGNYDGYWLNFEIVFLGKQLRFGDTKLKKLSLFRKGKGRYEKRLTKQDSSMLDIEVHEHVTVEGPVGFIKSAVRHENVLSLSRFIEKHNAYSNWEAHTILFGEGGAIPPSFFGSQAARRRWIRKIFLNFPGFPLAVFLYTFIVKLGFLDGKSGFYYAAFRGVQFLHIRAKLYELSLVRLSPE